MRLWRRLVKERVERKGPVGMGITVAVKVEHLALPKMLVSTPSEQSGTLLIPNMETYGTVKGTVKDFIRRNLFIPDELQVLQAPLFRKLSDKENVEDLYKRYLCQAEVEHPELHLDEDNSVFFAREGGRSIDLDDNLRLEEYHILEKTVLQLRRLPKPLSETGGRIFVETKEGILPLLGVTHATRVVDLKHALARMTGIPTELQLLSSVGRSMHDGLSIRDFDGPHRVCEDSTLDLCKSGDSNVEQAHCRMVISVDVMGEESFTMVVQSRDIIQSVQLVVEARTGVAIWQQRVTYSGKVLQEKKTLSDYFVRPDSALQVTIFRSPCSKPPPKMGTNFQHSRENSGTDEHNKPAARKIKLLRTSKGHIVGSVTIPVLTTDTVSDLKRKVRRTLQPLTERNFFVLRSPAGSVANSNNSTPNKATPSPVTKGDGISKGDGLSKGDWDQNSTSGRRLSRVLSFTGRTFSGHLGGNGATPPTTGKTTGAHQTEIDVDFDSLSSLPPPLTDGISNSNGKAVARALSFSKNFSGPLVSPNGKLARHRGAPDPQPAGTLYPPPLSSPSPASASPTNSSSSPDNSNQGIPHAKETVRKTVQSEDSLPPPLKFVPMRPTTVPIPPRSSTTSGSLPGDNSGRRLHRSHTRAASMGHISYTPSEFHSLPMHPAPQEKSVLPHTGPIVMGSMGSNATTTISPPKKGNGRGKDPNSGTTERRGLGAWLTDSMQTLKVHMKSPFADR